MKPRTVHWFMVVFDDKYELPLYVCDTAEELASFLRYKGGKNTIFTALSRSNGVARFNQGKRSGLKYFRINARTGEIITKEDT